MKPPLTNEQEILYTLIKRGRVSILDFPWLSGFRTRCSDLRLKRGLEMKTIKAQRYNKFSNIYTYHIHYLVDVEKAKSLYEKLTVNN